MRKTGIGKAVQTARNFPVTLPFVWIPDLTQLDLSPPRRWHQCDEEREHSRKWRWLEVRVVNVTFCRVNFIESTDPSGFPEKRVSEGKKTTYITKPYTWKVESDSDTCCAGSTTTPGKNLEKRKIYVCVRPFGASLAFKVKHTVVWIFRWFY